MNNKSSKNIPKIVKNKKNIKIIKSKSENANNNDIKTLLDKEIYDFLNKYIEFCNYVDKLNKCFENIQHIRKPNFPEIVSEYLAKICYEKKYKKNVQMVKGEGGDLKCGEKKLEVKAFSSQGPSSFGPTENWEELLFVDATKYDKHQFCIYRIPLSNKDKKWKNIKVNAKYTFEEQCIEGRRPRIQFSQIKNQLSEDNIEIMFEGKINIDNDKIIFQE